jgi:hypothetical protein
MAYTSTVPAVLDALVQRWTLAVPDALVVDCQPPRDFDSADLILVGFTGTPGAASVTNTISIEQMAVTPDREQYDITCMVSAWKGVEDDVKAVRDRAYEMVDLIAAALADDQTLGGLVMLMHLTTSTLAQYFTDDGVSADVQVVVSVDAFTRRS